MNWTRNSPYSLISDCGRYGIARATVNKEFKFTAILLGSKGRNTWIDSKRLGVVYSERECKQLCEQHKGRV